MLGLERLDQQNFEREFMTYHCKQRHSLEEASLAQQTSFWENRFERNDSLPFRALANEGELLACPSLGSRSKQRTRRTRNHANVRQVQGFYYRYNHAEVKYNFLLWNRPSYVLEFALGITACFCAWLSSRLSSWQLTTNAQWMCCVQLDLCWLGELVK